jgi:hypothetical protein
MQHDDIPIPKLPRLPMIPTRGRGKELMDLLRVELGIPEGVKWFEVRFALSEAISVKLEYTPRSREDDE